jgi:predicted nucleic acid-binding protein
LIFVDTSFWVALVHGADQRHLEAQTVLEAHGDGLLASSTHVIGETWTFTRRRHGYRAAVAMIDRIALTSRFEHLRTTEEDERIAWLWLRNRSEREYSFVDATSFVLMRRHAIREVFAFDGDFAAAGFVELRA